ncbi:DUF2142 domain-containing protein [Rhodopseudomonas boonkerdii]|nr:DUF2142 domain-containing protein [Rhodopseudomonas boonkerdii]
MTYLPAVVGIWLGKSSGLSVVRTLYLARLLTGIATTLIGAIAIAVAIRSALWLFCVLLLPMTLSQMNAVTQDGMIFAMAALGVAMLATSVRRRACHFEETRMGLCRCNQHRRHGASSLRPYGRTVGSRKRRFPYQENIGHRACLDTRARPGIFRSDSGRHAECPAGRSYRSRRTV